MHAAWKLVREVVSEYIENDCIRMGAALAYYTVFALAPMILIIMMGAGLFLSDQVVQEEIYKEINSMVGSASTQQVRAMVEAASTLEASRVASAISAFSLVFAASGVFYVIKDALNTIWKVKAVPKSGIAKFAIDRFRSFTVILSISFILLVSQVLAGIISGGATYLQASFPEITIQLVKVANAAASFGITTCLFAILFKTLPDVISRWSDVWAGAAVTAALFAAGKFLIAFYIGTADVASTYGAAGAIVVILLWVYYAAQILFLGAEFTYVYSRRFGSGSRPARDAVSIVGAATD